MGHLMKTDPVKNGVTRKPKIPKHRKEMCFYDTSPPLGTTEIKPFQKCSKCGKAVLNARYRKYVEKSLQCNCPHSGGKN